MNTNEKSPITAKNQTNPLVQPLSKALTISNIITVSRLILLPFIVYFIISDQRLIAFIILMISLLSDTVDGFLARKLHQESEAGKFLDPICDKISLMVILFTLYYVGSMPFWGVFIIILRDILILAGSFVLMNFKSRVYKSNLVGKITGFIFGAVISAYTLNWTLVGTILLYLSIPAMMISFAIYLKRYLKAMKGA